MIVVFRVHKKYIICKYQTFGFSEEHVCMQLKSAQFKVYGIGHKKNFNKLLKSVVKAKKHTEIGCMP